MSEITHLQLLLAAFAGWVGRKQTAIIAYLFEENRVLKEQLKSDGRRLRFTDAQLSPQFESILDGCGIGFCLPRTWLRI